MEGRPSFFVDDLWAEVHRALALLMNFRGGASAAKGGLSAWSCGHIVWGLVPPRA
jgi:hypothetical protein